MHVEEPESTYHTLGGWIFESIERVPSNGEQFDYVNLTLTVTEVENRRIRKVLVKINEHPVEEK